MKHAFLIIAHNEPEVLATLLGQLDVEGFDVYLHIDVRAAEMRRRFAAYHPQRGGFSLLENPMAVYWGDESQIEVELRLIGEAMMHGQYAYLHLLSGVDLMLKTPEVFCRFFEKHRGKELVGYWNTEAHQRDLRRKVSRYYLFTRHLKDRSSWRHHLAAPLRNVTLALQKLTHFRRRNGCFVFRKGSNWVSLTGDFCKYLLQHVSPLQHRLHHTLCPDEIFVQTMLWNSPFKENVFDAQTDDIEKSSLRKIDWQRGSPYVWQMADVGELLDSSALFARKFSGKHLDAVKAIEKATRQDSQVYVN